jgi:transcriptional regulator with XRE-family HTH domain
MWRSEFYADVAARIQLRRKQLEMRQEDVAQEMGISRASYANIEAGRQRVTVDAMWKLAVILGARLTDILPTPVSR